MSSLRSVDRSAVTREKVRVSICRFMFADGRRCRTPRSGSHPHFASPEYCRVVLLRTTASSPLTHLESYL
jgi:hypothetical protein